MRKKPRDPKRPANVMQFRGHAPGSEGRKGCGPNRRGPTSGTAIRYKRNAGKRRKGISTPLLVAIGLAAGALIGLGASKWQDEGWAVPELASQGLAGLGLASTGTQEVLSLCIANVHDGDTVRSCEGERIRIENIDAPELPDSPKCTDRRRNGWCDYDLARQSRDELAAFLRQGRVTIRRSGTDRYGRTLARLSVDGRDAGWHLVSMGLARPWL